MIPTYEEQAEPQPSGTNTRRGLNKMVLRLVKGGAERHAIETGQVDAIVDPTNGAVFLLPEAQQSLIESRSILHRLFELACDWSWEQDDQYRFIAHAGVNVENSVFRNEDIIGKTLLDLSIDNISEDDWAKHHQQQKCHTTFRNLEIRCINRSGEMQYLSFSGEPIFDDKELFKGYRGIARDITARRQERAILQAPNPYSSFTLNSVTVHVGLLDPTGVVLLANDAWQTFAATCTGIEAGVTEGDNYLDACDNADEHKCVDGTLIAAGIRQVLSGALGSFRHEYSCDSTAGKRWFVLDIVRANGDGLLHTVVLRKDITDCKRREILRELEYTIAICLADEDDAIQTLKTVIRAICKSQGWACGRYFQSDPMLGLHCFVEASAAPLAANDQFLEKSRDLSVYPGAGLTGRVFLSGHPLWVCDDPQKIEERARTLGPETGREGALVFPVTSNAKTIGVLAFTSDTVCEPDDIMLQTIKSIGSKLGRHLEREQALDGLRRREARFRKLTEISADWFWEQDSDLRFTQYVGCGASDTSEVIGRGFWELPNIVVVDSAMREHKLQLNARWSFFDFEFATVQPDGKLRHYSICGEPVYDEAGEFSGYCGTGRDITDGKISLQ